MDISHESFSWYNPLPCDIVCFLAHFRPSTHNPIIEARASFWPQSISSDTCQILSINPLHALENWNNSLFLGRWMCKLGLAVVYCMRAVWFFPLFDRTICLTTIQLGRCFSVDNSILQKPKHHIPNELLFTLCLRLLVTVLFLCKTRSN